jgi:hypothetical protein
MTELYNAFISYAWRDNETIHNSGNGWVSTFVDGLRKLLSRELPRKISQNNIWFDYEQMRGSDNISDKIRAKVEASRFLVPIISKSYLQSPWCRQELKIFIEKNGRKSGRIFPVWMDPVEEDIPEELDALLKYQFWYKDDRNQPRPRWFPDINPTDRDYSFIQQDMARDMAACLKDIVAAEQETDPPKQITPTTPTATIPGGDHKVLVNGGEDDRELINQVATCLSNDHNVNAFLPLSALPDAGKLKSSERNRDLREKLKFCTAVLMVYRSAPAEQIHGYYNEYQKSVAKTSKNNQPPSLDICYPAECGPPPGIFLPKENVHSCDGDCAADCAEKFVGGLTS